MIEHIDIKDKKEFVFQGDKLVQYKSYGDGWWLYKRYNQYTNFNFMGWELVKGKKDMQPNGDVVYIYPSSRLFGTYGYFLPKRTTEEEADQMHTKMCQISIKSQK